MQFVTNSAPGSCIQQHKDPPVPCIHHYHRTIHAPSIAQTSCFPQTSLRAAIPRIGLHRMYLHLASHVLMWNIINDSSHIIVNIIAKKNCTSIALVVYVFTVPPCYHTPQLAGADPGPLVGQGANRIYFINFLINPMKYKKIWSGGGRRV